MQELINKYLDFRKKIKAFDYIGFILGFDAETQAPKQSFLERGRQIETISGFEYDISLSKEYLDLVKELYLKRNELDPILETEISLIYKRNSKQEKIPKEELIKFQVLMSQSAQIWAEAKQNNDYKAFLPILEKVLLFPESICNIRKL